MSQGRGIHPSPTDHEKHTHSVSPIRSYFHPHPVTVIPYLQAVGCTKRRKQKRGFWRRIQDYYAMNMHVGVEFPFRPLSGKQASFTRFDLNWKWLVAWQWTWKMKGIHFVRGMWSAPYEADLSQGGKATVAKRCWRRINSLYFVDVPGKLWATVKLGFCILSPCFACIWMHRSPGTHAPSLATNVLTWM